MSQTSACADRRRSGRAASDRRTNAQVMATVSANHATSATCLGHPGEGHHELRERRQVFVLVVPILRPVQRLVRKEPHRRGARHGEVDQFSALVANEGVGAGDDQQEEDGPDEQSQPRRHALSVPCHGCVG